MVRAKFEELKLIIHEYSPVCLAPQETMLGERAFGLKDYTGYHSKSEPETGSQGGSALLIRKDIAYIPLVLNTPLQAGAVQIKLLRVYTVGSPFTRVPFARLLICTSDQTEKYHILLLMF